MTRQAPPQPFPGASLTLWWPLCLFQQGLGSFKWCNVKEKPFTMGLGQLCRSSLLRWWVCRQILRWSKLFPPQPKWCQMLAGHWQPTYASCALSWGILTEAGAAAEIWGKMMPPAAGLPQEHPRHNYRVPPSHPVEALVPTNPCTPTMSPTLPPQVLR